MPVWAEGGAFTRYWLNISMASVGQSDKNAAHLPSDQAGTGKEAREKKRNPNVNGFQPIKIEMILPYPKRCRRHKRN